MISIIFAIVLGILFAIIAIQNPEIIPLHFYGYTVFIPTFMFGALAFLTGILVSLLFHLFEMTVVAFDLHNKDSKIHQVVKDNQALLGDLQKLKFENEKYREELGIAKSEAREEKLIRPNKTLRAF